MKKILTVLVILAVVSVGAFATFTAPSNATLTLKFLKSTTSQYNLGWYTNASAGVSMTEGSFNDDQGATQTVTSYLKAVSNYSDTAVKLSASLANLTHAADIEKTPGVVDTTTISYSVTLTSSTPSTITLSQTALASSSPATTVEFGAMPSNTTITQTAWVQFIFTPSATDLAAALANTSYSGDVVITMASN